MLLKMPVTTLPWIPNFDAGFCKVFRRRKETSFVRVLIEVVLLHPSSAKTNRPFLHVGLWAHYNSALRIYSILTLLKRLNEIDQCNICPKQLIYLRILHLKGMPMC